MVAGYVRARQLDLHDGCCRYGLVTLGTHLRALDILRSLQGLMTCPGKEDLAHIQGKECKAAFRSPEHIIVPETGSLLTWLSTYIHKYIRTYVCTCIHACMHAGCMYTYYTYISTSTSPYDIYTYIYIYVYLCICMYLHNNYPYYYIVQNT